jgi:uncharacterized membrane protein YfcA
MEFGLDILVVMALIFLFAAFVHGSIGFGFPMLATPLLALITDLQTAIILTLIPTILVNVVSIVSEGNILLAFRRHILLAFLAMLGGAIGTQILVTSNAEIFKVLLACAIIIYLLAEKIKLNLVWVRQYPRFSRIIFGISAGILGGLTNVMAPVLIIYSLESRYSKSDLIQASNFCFLFGKIIQLVLFSFYGKFTTVEFSISSLMLIAVSLALFFGLKIRKKIKASAYIKALRTLLLTLAAVLILQVLL